MLQPKIISQWDRGKELERLFGMEFKGGRRFSLERNKGISVMSFPAYCLRKYTSLPCPLTRNVFIPLCYSFKSYYFTFYSPLTPGTSSAQRCTVNIKTPYLIFRLLCFKKDILRNSQLRLYVVSMDVLPNQKCA